MRKEFPGSSLEGKALTLLIPRGPIGFEFSIKPQGDVIVVSQVRAGGTAERAGLQCGSILRAVNGQSIQSLPFLHVSNMIRRSSGFLIEIAVLEPLKPEDVKPSLLGVDQQQPSLSVSPVDVSPLSIDNVEKESSSARGAFEVLHEATPSPTPSSSLLSRSEGRNSEGCLSGRVEEEAAIAVDASSDPPSQPVIRATVPPSLSTDVPRGLRRQAILFSRSTEHPLVILPTSSAAADAAAVVVDADDADEQATRRQKQQRSDGLFNDVVSRLDSALQLAPPTAPLPPLQPPPPPVRAEAVPPPLVRRQAYVSAANAASSSSSFLTPVVISSSAGRPRCREGGGGGGGGGVVRHTSDGLRFLPAHTPSTHSSFSASSSSTTTTTPIGAAVPPLRVVPPALTFLPRHPAGSHAQGCCASPERSLRRKPSSTVVSSAGLVRSARREGGEELLTPQGESTAERTYTNLADYLERFDPSTAPLEVANGADLQISSSSAAEGIYDHRRLADEDPLPAPSTAVARELGYNEVLHRSASASQFDRLRRDSSSCLPALESLSDALVTGRDYRRRRRNWLKGFRHDEALDDLYLVRGRREVVLRRCKSVHCAHAPMIAGSYKSEQCLCNLTRLDGKESKCNNWRRYYLCIDEGLIRFVQAASTTNFYSFRGSQARRGGNSDGKYNDDDDATEKQANFSLMTSLDPFSLEGVSTSRCVVLPLPGLLWTRRPNLPSDVPAWGVPATTTTTTAQQRPEMVESSPISTAHRLSDLRCYDFEHPENGGTRVSVIFPNEETLDSTLLWCQKYGGLCKENSPPQTVAHPLVYSHSTQAFQTSPQQPYEKPDMPPRSGRGLRRGLRKSLPDSAATRRKFLAGAKRTRDTSKERTWDPPPPTSPLVTTSADPGQVAGGGGGDGGGTSKFRYFFSSSSNPFLKSIANFLGTARGGLAVSSSGSPLDPEELSRRIAAVIGEPPDFSELKQPGPVFGALLENQIPSADFPNVPLVLHALVVALELHGLHHVGLYRAPGRQKEIHRFVCLANLTVLDPGVLLQLDTWKDVRVLTGIIKHFLRHLGKPIFNTAFWEPLACVVPEASGEWTTSSLAYALLAILVKLRKVLVDETAVNATVLQEPQGGTVLEKPTPPPTQWRFRTVDFLFDHLRRVVALEGANQCSFECVAICFGPSLFGGDSIVQHKLNKILEVMLQHWPWLVSGMLGASSDPSGRDTRVESTPPPAGCASRSASSQPTLLQTESYVEHFFAHGTPFAADSTTASSISTDTAASLLDAAGNINENDVPLGHTTEEVISTVRAIFTRAGFALQQSPRKPERTDCPSAGSSGLLLGPYEDNDDETASSFQTRPISPIFGADLTAVHHQPPPTSHHPSPYYY